MLLNPDKMTMNYTMTDLVRKQGHFSMYRLCLS